MTDTTMLPPLPEPEELTADYNDAGRIVAIGYTAATVRRLIAEAVEKDREEWRTRQNMTLASPEMATHMERLKERIATEPGYALGLMVDAGICNSDGTLTEQFGGCVKGANDG